MLRRPLVAANWKMHGQKAQVGDLVQELITGLFDVPVVEILVCPAFVHLPLLSNVLQGTRIQLGAQNLHPASEGPFTGEISGPMLKEAGCSHDIVGHSERRHLFGESDDFIVRKFHAAQNCGLVPILCVGETAQERKSGATADVVTAQINAVLEKCGIASFAYAVIAYEPVWAIGTGVTATPGQAQEVHALIRQTLAQHDESVADAVRILYGGSVKAANSEELFAQPDIDGGLVGGASLIADEFIAICDSAYGLKQVS